MNIPIEIVCVFLTGVVGLQAWTLVEVVRLKTIVAGLTQWQRDLERKKI
jgi:hypothetical protein